MKKIILILHLLGGHAVQIDNRADVNVLQHILSDKNIHEYSCMINGCRTIINLDSIRYIEEKFVEEDN